MNTDKEIRDWYAGQALLGLLADCSLSNTQAEDVAKACFDYAEAMMAERQKRNIAAQKAAMTAERQRNIAAQEAAAQETATNFTPESDVIQHL